MENERLITLFDLVEKEAVNLKLHATKEELEKLNLKKFKYWTPKECIYGLLTGSCNSDRASELISKCCSKVYFPDKKPKSMFLYEVLNETPNEIDKHCRTQQFASPIEKWLFISSEENHKKLIEYLKDETIKLNLIKPWEQ